jgi:thiamine transport system substrate-binding protein
VQKLFRNVAILVISIFGTLTLAGCSSATIEPNEITVVVHDSVIISDALLAEFKTQTGLAVKIIRAGDAGAMTNKLVLTKDQPIADVVYGIDNIFAGVANANGVIDGELTEVNYGDVCMNYDRLWFAKREQAAPKDIRELVQPQFYGLTVLQNPNTSSTGLAFLAATVSVFGDPGYKTYWQQLKANNVKVTAGWEDAYFADFSGSSGKGEFPIVLSYSSSPASEIREDGFSQTEALLDSCYRQTEFAGVLTKAKNKAGAEKFVEFLLSKSFQSSLPESMYVYPIVSGIDLPEAWQQFAPVTDRPVGGELDLNANRELWLKAWSDIFAG